MDIEKSHHKKAPQTAHSHSSSPFRGLGGQGMGQGMDLGSGSVLSYLPSADLPRALEPDDVVAVTAPAGAFDTALLEPAIDVLECADLRTRVMPHACSRRGSYSGSADERWADLEAALTDSDIRAVMCARGGYGATHLLERLARLPMPDRKWLIGFSDISAIHAVMVSRGMLSIHAPMLRGLVRDGAPDTGDTATLIDILKGKLPSYTLGSDPRNRPGHATGILAGGNLSVLAGLISTPYDIIRPGTILFIEDINEPIYKIERILWQLRHSGALQSLGGLLVGQFTGTKPDANYNHIYDMIADMVSPYAYPVAYDIPVGHVPHNVPLIEGAQVRLLV